MKAKTPPGGRRERAKTDKRRRIVDAARTLFADADVGSVTTQQIAERADVAIGTLYLYAATKAELLIMVQNEKFAAAIAEGLGAVEALNATTATATERVIALVTPVIACVREHPENGRTYLHELVFGDPLEPRRAEGLALAWRLEEGVSRVFGACEHVSVADAATLARIVTAIVHITLTASAFRGLTPAEIVADLGGQIRTILGPFAPPAGKYARDSRGGSGQQRPLRRKVGRLRASRRLRARRSSTGGRLARPLR